MPAGGIMGGTGKRPRAGMAHAGDEESASLLLQESSSPPSAATSSSKLKSPSPPRASRGLGAAARPAPPARCTLQRGLAVLGAALIGAMVLNVLTFQPGGGGGGGQQRPSPPAPAPAAGSSKGSKGSGGLLNDYIDRLQSIITPAAPARGPAPPAPAPASPPAVVAPPPPAPAPPRGEGGGKEEEEEEREKSKPQQDKEEGQEGDKPPSSTTNLRGRWEQQQQDKEEPPKQPAAAGKGIGSDVDLEAALVATKAKIKKEQARAAAAKAGGGGGGGQQKQEQQEEKAEDGGEAEAAPAPPSPAEKEEATGDNGDLESPTFPQIQPAGAKATRPPLSTANPPPLHRRREEVQVQRVLLTVSSTDRGQRINHMWEGDKLDTMCATLQQVVALCERGFDLTVWFVAAWKVSLEEKRVNEALACQRIGGPVEVRYWDDYPEEIGGTLSSRHRLAMASVVDEFDLFISIEDDIYLLPSHVDAFLAASHRLALSPDNDTWYPGFSRVEHDAHRDQAWATWETDLDDYRAVEIPGSGVFAEVMGNTHQAMWIATREQMYNLDARCQGGFFNISHPEDASWVEFWSGALQLWDSPEHCGGLRKGMPVAFFRDLTVWHMTDTKLYTRGKGVTPVEAIVRKLERQRAAILAGGTAEDAEWEDEEEDWGEPVVEEAERERRRRG